MPSNKELQDKIRELEEKVRLLNEENITLTERAEEIVLLAMLSETLLEVEDKEQIIDKILEQLSILKGIPYCAFGRLVGNTIIIKQEYSSFHINEADSLSTIHLNDLLRNKLKNSSGQLTGYINEFEHFNSSNEMNKLETYLLSNIELNSPDNVLIFFDGRDRIQFFQEFIPSLLQIINLLVLKFSNLSLLEDLKNSQVRLRKKVEESEVKFRSMIAKSPEGILLHEEGKILYANKVMLNLLEADYPDQLLGRSIFDFTQNIDKEYILDRLKNIKKDVPQAFTEYKLKSLKNNDLAVEIGGTPIIENGELRTFLTVRDISDRKIIENALELQRDFLTAVMDSITSPLYVINVEDYSIIMANKAGNALRKKSSRKCYEISHNSSIPCHEAGSECPLNRVLETGKPAKSEHFHVDEYGKTRQYSVNAYPIYNEKGELIQILEYNQDITERKQFEEDLKFAKEKAEIADRLKSEFLAKISHEIRTPLNNIINYLQLVKDEVNEENNETLTMAFNSINRSSKRIIRTVDLILNMSELELGSYFPSVNDINLYASILQPIYNEYHHDSGKKGVEFTLEKKCSSNVIRGDSYSIYQIVENLVDNAIKYTNSGYVNMVLDSDEKFIILEINDTGIGIEKEYLKELFNPFTQEDQGYTRQYDGSGLGMAVVKSYCELNNASIDVYSEKNVGTKFTVKFKRIELNNSN